MFRPSSYVKCSQGPIYTWLAGVLTIEFTGGKIFLYDIIGESEIFLKLMPKTHVGKNGKFSVCTLSNFFGIKAIFLSNILNKHFEIINVFLYIFLLWERLMIFCSFWVVRCQGASSAELRIRIRFFWFVSGSGFPMGRIRFRVLRVGLGSGPIPNVGNGSVIGSLQDRFFLKDRIQINWFSFF